MEVKEIIAAIRNSRSLDISDDITRKNLLLQHFSEEEIDKAFAMLPKQETPQSMQTPLAMPPLPSVPMPSVQTIISPSMWYDLMQLFSFLCLYLLSASIGVMLHFDIDRWFPATTHYIQTNFVHFAIASLLVTLPIFSYVFIWLTNYPYTLKQARTSLPTKFFTYATVIISFFAMIMSIVFLIFSMLEGIGNTNVFFHSFVSLCLSTIIFLYYISQIKAQNR